MINPRPHARGNCGWVERTSTRERPRMQPGNEAMSRVSLIAIARTARSPAARPRQPCHAAAASLISAGLWKAQRAGLSTVRR